MKKFKLDENVIPSVGNNKISREWIKNKKLSCRYDCFFLLYTFIMRPILENEKNNKAVRVYSKISDEILNSDAAKLNEGIWNIIVNLKEDPFKFKDEWF